MSFFSQVERVASQVASQVTVSPLAMNVSFTGGRGGASSQGLPMFSSHERVSGEIKCVVSGGKRFDHQGVRVELKGVLEASTEKRPHEFLSLVKELSPAGSIAGLLSLPFSFEGVDFPVESYSGVNARVKYFVRAIASTKGGFVGGGGSERKEAEFCVRTPHATAPAVGAGGSAGGGVDAAALAADLDAPIKLEVGIEDCLHIEFEYSRMRYHLSDIVTGHIDFKQLGIKLRKMEVAVVRKENVGAGECAPLPPPRTLFSPPHALGPDRTTHNTHARTLPLPPSLPPPFFLRSWVASVHL